MKIYISDLNLRKKRRKKKIKAKQTEANVSTSSFTVEGKVLFSF